MEKYKLYLIYYNTVVCITVGPRHFLLKTIVSIYVPYFLICALDPILFGMPYFWLETTKIIKIESNLCYPIIFCLISMGMKDKKDDFLGFDGLKKCDFFQTHQFSIRLRTIDNEIGYSHDKISKRRRICLVF